MTFDHIRWAFIRAAAKDEQVDREIAQRLFEMAQHEDRLRIAVGRFIPPPGESYQRSVRRLWRPSAEPLVTAETAAWLEEQFQR